jgi:hypothetical protein
MAERRACSSTTARCTAADVMRAFAEGLFGKDRIWCALTRDTIPDLSATIRPMPPVMRGARTGCST